MGRSNDHVFDQRFVFGCTIKTANHWIQGRIEMHQNFNGEAHFSLMLFNNDWNRAMIIIYSFIDP